MHPDKAQRLLWTLAAIGFATAIVGAVGELLGWWNDVGQILMGSGTLVGVVMSSSSLLLGSSSEQVAAIRSGQETTHATLGSMDGRLDSMDGKLESVDGKLGSMDTKMGSMDDKLDDLDELDRIQVELDQQTGVLEDIRDLL